VIITLAELLAGGERANRKGLRGWSWYCMTKMVQVRQGTIHPNRIDRSAIDSDK
jgi:hypothetical protein